jgi:hypothetical protein
MKKKILHTNQQLKNGIIYPGLSEKENGMVKQITGLKLL